MNTVVDQLDGPAFSIEYRGHGAREDADAIRGAMAGGGFEIAPPREIEDDGAALGPLEIVLTFVVTLAAKAAITLALRRLEEHFKRRAKPRHQIGFQVALRKPGMSIPKRFPFRLQDHSEEALSELFERLRKAVDDL